MLNVAFEATSVMRADWVENDFPLIAKLPVPAPEAESAKCIGTEVPRYITVVSYAPIAIVPCEATGNVAHVTPGNICVDLVMSTGRALMSPFDSYTE